MLLLAIDFDNLHQILQNLYVEMMPLCSKMTGVARGLAGLGALFYVAYRVWQALARAESVDVFPLLRPFALGLCIMFFPTLVLGTLNSILSPVVKGTHTILESQTFDMNEYRAQKDKLEIEAMKRNPETAYLVDKETFDNRLDELGAFDAIEACGMYVDRAMYNMKRAVQNFFRELLELLFNAAALVIDTLRTFFLIVLSILGPVSFAHLLLGRFPSFSQPVVRPLYQHLPLASCQRPVQQCAGENPGADATEGYRAAFRSGFHPRQFKRGFTSLSSLSASSGISPYRPYQTGLCKPEAVQATTSRM